ncbi:MAG: hypothetical protein IJE89_03150 [Bacilli bacterium]|nr:hypothetical protein [Bacilli bacterium]
MYDYNYGYGTPSYDTGASLLGGLFASMGLMLLISSAVGILMLISQWKIYKKAGKKGWECLVPIYNIIVLLEIVKLPMWYIALFFVPIANIYAMFKIYIELAHKFGKSTGFGVLTVFFSVVCLPILAFGKDNIYQGGNNQVNTTNNMTPPMNNMNNQYNQINNMNNMSNFQNSGEPVMFNQTMNTNVNPMPEPMVNVVPTVNVPTEPVINQTTTIPQPVEPIIPMSIDPVITTLNGEPAVNFNQPMSQPVESVMPTQTVNVVPEINVNQNVENVTSEPVVNNQINTVPEPVTMINPTQVIPQEPVMNNDVNIFNQDNNQNM